MIHLNVPRRKIELSEYSVQYPKLFQHERAMILDYASEIVEEIEHVGSTAIPNIIGKPTIDMVVKLRKDITLDNCVEIFTAINYNFISSLVGYRPKRRIFWKGSSDHHKFHVHAVENQSPDWELLIKFRDKLIKSEKLKRRYESIKFMLKDQDEYDVGSYIAGKDDFFWEVVNDS